MVERRLRWLAGIVLLWSAVIFLKLISLQAIHHRYYAEKALHQQEDVVEIPAPRGAILDRSGQPLALSLPAKSVYVNPLRVNIESASNLLSRVLHLDRAELYAKMKWARDHHRGDLRVKRYITDEERQSVRNQPVEYIDVRDDSQRRYPGGGLAAHVLGGVDFEEKGNAGIEKALDAELRGVPGKVRLLKDANDHGIDSQVDVEARAGAALTLTIDERTQFVAERELEAAVAAHHAVSGSVVVMNPNTGDVLALASYPTYDPNVPPQPGDDPDARLNHATSVPFEPGSVFKVMTLSAALETTDLRPETLINCHNGVLKLPGRTIHDSHGGLGLLPMSEVLARSSNIGAIMIGTRVGQDNLYEYVHRFGFGHRTGIQLPAESPGKLRKLPQWGTTSLASVSMGQEVSVTTLQLAQAGSVIASGGLLVKPRLILKKDDRTVPREPPVRIIQAETAFTMREMMNGVVEHGTGMRAQLSGYTVGGKTGSAQIYDYATKHYLHAYNGTFMGFAPLTNPAIVVVVTLNGTHGESGFGGVAAAPAFRAIAAEALRVLDVPKDRAEQPAKTLLAKAMVDAPPDDTGSGMLNILEEPDDGDDSAAPESSGPKVPNFRGMTMRAVLAAAADQGFTVVPNGSGVARAQAPPPGSALRQGEPVRVVFTR
jgi:cell division protein FtsI (penicillin-binding protein 3)